MYHDSRMQKDPRVMWGVTVGAVLLMWLVAYLWGINIGKNIGHAILD